MSNLLPRIVTQELHFEKQDEHKPGPDPTFYSRGKYVGHIYHDKIRNSNVYLGYKNERFMIKDAWAIDAKFIERAKRDWDITHVVILNDENDLWMFDVDAYTETEKINHTFPQYAPPIDKAEISFTKVRDGDRYPNEIHITP